MAGFDILHPGVWFGPKTEQEKIVPFDGIAKDSDRLQEICSQFKLGDFSVRHKLQNLIVTSQDPLVRQQAIRLFCYTCRHNDIDFLGNLLGQVDSDEVLTIVITFPDTLSPEIIPFLFALLGENEGTLIAQDIFGAINRLFPWGYTGEDVDLVWLAEHFSGFAKKLMPGAYYYGGAPAHPGELCKSLIEVTIRAKNENSKFPLINIPILLSTWSGEICPVCYGEVIDDQKVQEVFSYVSDLAKLPWETGAKYFYSHKIE